MQIRDKIIVKYLSKIKSKRNLTIMKKMKKKIIKYLSKITNKINLTIKKKKKKIKLSIITDLLL